MISRQRFVESLPNAFANAVGARIKSAAVDSQLNPDGFVEVGDELTVTLAHAWALNGKLVDTFANLRVTNVMHDVTNGYSDVSIGGGFLHPLTLRVPMLAKD